MWSYAPMNTRAWAATVFLIALGAMTVMFVVDKSTSLRNKMRGFLHLWHDWIIIVFAAGLLLASIRGRVFGVTPDGILLGGPRRRKQLIPWQKIIGLRHSSKSLRQGWHLIVRRRRNGRCCKARYIPVENLLHAQVSREGVRWVIQEAKRNHRRQPISSDTSSSSVADARICDAQES